jgi:hypothetical protein
MTEEPKSITTPALTEINFYELVEDSNFSMDIDRFNTMYRLADCSRLAPSAMSARLQVFKGLILEELTELDDIRTKLDGGPGYASLLDARTDIADLLGDLIVFCASEMRRFDIHTEDILAIIMASNFSKCDENGNPIYRESDGKVMKGPNYWKPEPLIREYLEQCDELEADRAGGAEIPDADDGS